MVEEVVIRIKNCNDCPYMRYVFTVIGITALECIVAKEKDGWHLGVGIPNWCPLRKEVHIQKARRMRKEVRV